ncbi:TRAP transporter permease [Microvirga sp. 17 mud 1-3]|uniref:TRAP transporter permease n=1 Tax=Microvirga sp. 17 mud 1-3 TaxID=2082949 RepID=UPI000D6BE296|nr:TRAP transporter permease [Microvirga sp. 17 mud 1-3]AWM85369.1 C4-dicarboxylate ABC transporter [Microvirga sp. 17 mud 1-3]
MTRMHESATATRAELEDMVAEADTGGRKPKGMTRIFIFWTAVAWSLFQVWYASPIPFIIRAGVFNDSEARAIHLAFAMTLAFLTFPRGKASPRSYVPVYDWVLAALGAASALYLFFFYRELAQRPGLPTTLDIVVAVTGILVLLEAARRAVGPALAVIAALMLAYIFAGPWLGGLFAHRGASLGRAASQMWLTSEGVFGVAIGVSTSFIFLYVLFGTLLEKAGAGHYFIQLAYSLLGHYRGGPAKAGVVASGMTGMISGSSIANTVTTGTFTIPLMKRVGYPAVKAGAIECAAGVNGQLMPPVMGAAAFLIAEYVGISYAEVVKHAFIPALLTYGALFYIVDIEAMKMGLVGGTRVQRHPLSQRLVKALATWCGLIILAGIVYFALGAVKTAFGTGAPWVTGIGLTAAYVGLLWNKARHPDLPEDDPAAATMAVPDFYETARTGLHYLIPVVVLIWCLLVEEMSPGLAAFWGTMTLVFVVLTQRPIVVWFRGHGDVGEGLRRGIRECIDALEAAARNMTGVGIATAAAGIIVGTVALTGIGLVMTEIVEALSGGNLIIMLLLTAGICLVLGMGMPTTASYVVVATLMAPVLIEVSAQNDLAVPLVAVHLFVFYFGLMADVTPPVGLAAYAAAAISGADPVKTGIQGFKYEIRTGLLPFIFIFNAELLLIDIRSWWQFTLVLVCATIGMACFVAASQNWLLVRNRLWETLALILICFTLFRPHFWLNMLEPAYEPKGPDAIATYVDTIPRDGTLRLRVLSQSRAGDDVEKLVRLSLRAEGTPEQRLGEAGLILAKQGDDMIVRSAKLGSEAAQYGLQPGDTVKSVLVPTERSSPYWATLPALALLGLIIVLQRGRRRAAA